MPIGGGCLCGKIRYTIRGKFLGSGLCCCRDCQYTCGGSAAAGFVIMRDALEVAGTPRIYASTTHLGGTARRHFCEICGTPLFGEKTSAPGTIAIMAGTLDHPDLFRPQAVSWKCKAPTWLSLPHIPAYERDIGP